MKDLEHEIALICECSGDKAVEIIALVEQHFVEQSCAVGEQLKAPNQSVGHTKSKWINEGFNRGIDVFITALRKSMRGKTNESI